MSVEEVETSKKRRREKGAEPKRGLVPGDFVEAKRVANVLALLAAESFGVDAVLPLAGGVFMLARGFPGWQSFSRTEGALADMGAAFGKLFCGGKKPAAALLDASSAQGGGAGRTPD